MKAQLTAKYLQFLSKKNKNQSAGFTLIELLVVIIIIGILSAIALPSFLNQASKARQSEARTNVGAMNRAQQSYYLENQAFVAGDDAITKLAIGIKDSDNFNYTAVSETPADDVINNGIAKNDDLKSYAGGVFKETASGTTTSFLCEENAPVEGVEAVTTPPTSAGCQGETTALK